MLGKMRVISNLLLSAVMLLLLTLKVLPHHHHVLHLSESDVVVETLHFGVEGCDEGGDSSHSSREECPSEHIYYIASACEELDYYKYTQYYSYSLAILAAGVELLPPSDVATHAPPYINLKIPDGRAIVLSLRAPPYTVS